MKTKMIIFSLIGILVFASCVPKTVQVTPDPAIETAVVQVMQTKVWETAQAQFTETAVAQPTYTPTEVPTITVELPTNTALPPTNTPLPPTPYPTLAPPTSTPILATATPSATPTRSDLNCQVISSSPSNYQTMSVGQDFDGHWTLKNTGSNTWDQASVDFSYVSGTKFQTKVDAIDLPATVSNGNTVDVIIDMIAPTNAGNYQATWALREGSVYFCYVNVNITVK